MSYNTRRSGGYSTGPAPQQQQQSVGNIGQRRPVVTNNFVPGGQLNTQNKQPGAQQANPQQRPPVQVQQQQGAQNPNAANFRNQQNQGYQQQQQQKPAPPPQQQPPPPVQQQQIKTDTPAPSNMPKDTADLINNDGNEQAMDTSDESVPKKRPFWARAGAGNKISKKEKMRRRNVRLSKILQPKNAVMILNELVKNTAYVVDEMPVKVDSNQFKAAVLVDGIEHAGYGRSKIHAKNSAAETALKHLIKSNKLTEMKTDDEGNEKMDVSEDDTQQSPLPWQHFASFALYKLFTSWGEDPNIVKGNKSQINNGQGEKDQEKHRPAKKMPPNPETINPLMLINQMLPHAQFEEIGKSGNPPNVTYSYRCTVDGQSFIGTVNFASMTCSIWINELPKLFTSTL